MSKEWEERQEVDLHEQHSVKRCAVEESWAGDLRPFCKHGILHSFSATWEKLWDRVGWRAEQGQEEAAEAEMLKLGLGMQGYVERREGKWKR